MSCCGSLPSKASNSPAHRINRTAAGIALAAVFVVGACRMLGGETDIVGSASAALTSDLLA